MALIHPTALIDPAAELDSSVTVGAYSLIGPHVKIGAGTKVGPHVVIEGHTTIGRDNTFFQFSSIGAANQDKKYAGEPTTLVIGDRNTVREFCTLNVGTVQDRGETTVGHDNWIMAYCHLAHDVVIGNECVLANGATLVHHDVYPDPADGGQPPYRVVLRALDSGFEETQALGSMRVLTRVQGDAGDPVS